MTGSIEVDGFAPSTMAVWHERAAGTAFAELIDPARPLVLRPAATVLVCDRLRAVAESLAGYLDSAPGLAASGIATTAAQLLTLLDARPSDLVVLDAAVRLEESAGESLVAAIRRRHPATRVLMIGSTEDPGAVARALREGALGWLTVDGTAPQLAEASFGVLRGEYRIAPGLLAAALGVAAGSPANALGASGDRRAGVGDDASGDEVLRSQAALGERDHPAADARDGGRPEAGRAGVLLARLSERERLVLSCLVGGMHRRDIAARLGIAETTARTHISRILAKLDAHSMIEAAALGRRAGLAGIEP